MFKLKNFRVHIPGISVTFERDGHGIDKEQKTRGVRARAALRKPDYYIDSSKVNAFFKDVEQFGAIGPFGTAATVSSIFVGGLIGAVSGSVPGAIAGVLIGGSVIGGPLEAKSKRDSKKRIRSYIFSRTELIEIQRILTSNKWKYYVKSENLLSKDELKEVTKYINGVFHIR